MPPMSEVLDLLKEAVAPALLGALIPAIVLPLILGRRASFAASALGATLGVLAGNYQREALAITFDWQASPGRAWLLWVGVAAVLVEGGVRLLRLPHWLAWPARAAASFGLARLGVPAELAKAHPWTAWAAGAGSFGIWAAGLALKRFAPAGLTAAASLCGCWASAVVLLYAHSARLFDSAVVLGAATLGVGVAARWGRGAEAGALPFAALFLPALMASGQYETFSEVPETAFMLAAFAPAGAIIAAAVACCERAGWRWVFGLVGAGLPALAAVILALRNEELSFG
jgi:hypothetical protein